MLNDLTATLQTIQELPQFIREKAKAILLKNAYAIQSLALIRVPVKTGELQDSIQVIDEGDRVSVVAGGPDAPYAVYVEEKTPFMESSFYDVLPQISEQLRMIQQEIDNKAPKGGVE